MALKMVKGSIDRMFDKNLQDLVRGIRNHKEDEAKYVSQCINEIQQELKQDNISVKANAICKLTYVSTLVRLPGCAGPGIADTVCRSWPQGYGGRWSLGQQSPDCHRTCK
ncbi:AP-3 complex subunit delta-1-like isoform X1 [Elephas maximus indicus]|uniref:AP-3 complex subunit delta-1-like isoform X1 n=1 Tax=Elephas maximus indicus TaxID=99487 RepID=UPI00211709FA|nr:AP-3 complex subunit delta-1-like isoform X1 [Elephas maximus indicus]